jgi:hypothetical protein
LDCSGIIVKITGMLSGEAQGSVAEAAIQSLHLQTRHHSHHAVGLLESTIGSWNSSRHTMHLHSGNTQCNRCEAARYTAIDLSFLNCREPSKPIIKHSQAKPQRSHPAATGLLLLPLPCPLSASASASMPCRVMQGAGCRMHCCSPVCLDVLSCRRPKTSVGRPRLTTR